MHDISDQESPQNMSTVNDGCAERGDDREEEEQEYTFRGYLGSPDDHLSGKRAVVPYPNSKGIDIRHATAFRRLIGGGLIKHTATGSYPPSMHMHL